MADDHGHDGGHGDNHGGNHSHAGDETRREPFIFAGILGMALLIPIALLFVFKVSLPVAILSLALILLIATLAPHLYEFKEYERGVVFYLGKFDKVVGPGWVLLFPAVHSFERVDLRTQVLDIEPQVVITSENISLNIEAVVYVKIDDPKKVILEVKDVHKAASELIHGELRARIGKLTMNQVIENTEALNHDLEAALEKVERAWGIHSVSVEITDITMPTELEESFLKQKEASQYKEKVEIEAQARRDVLRIINETAKEMDDRTITYLYLDTLKRMADGRATKIVFPIELMHLASKLEDQIKSGTAPETLRKIARTFFENKTGEKGS